MADACQLTVILLPPLLLLLLLAEALFIIEAKTLDPFFLSFLFSYDMLAVTIGEEVTLSS